MGRIILAVQLSVFCFMASGDCTVTPGVTLTVGQRVTQALLNLLGVPAVRVNAGSIGERELVAAAVRQLVPSVNRNALINGNFDVWQRGGYTNLSGLPVVLGATANTVYGADRWLLGGATGVSKRNITRQSFATGQADVPNEPTYFLRWNELAGETGGYRPILAQPIEDVRTLAGKPVVVSWWMKGNYSGDVTCQLVQFFGGAPGQSRTIAATSGGTATLINGAAWTKFTAKFTVPTLAGYGVDSPNASLILQFLLPDNVTFQIDFAQVQLEEGTDATGFETLAYLETLRRCERYFEYHGGVAADDITHNHPCYYFATRKYRAPTITIVGAITGAGVAFSTILDVGYQQSTVNSAVTTFFVGCEAELFL